MAFIDTLINVGISEAPTPVSAELTSIPLLISDVDPGWSGDDVVRTYGSVAELNADGVAANSAMSTYATRLLSSDIKPAYFMVGRKAGAALAASDLDAMFEADSRPYGIVPVKATDDEILTLADWVEGQDKLAVTASASANNGDATAKDSVAAVLKSKSYRRTGVIFSPGSADKGIDAGWLGTWLPQTPGLINPAYQLVPGISADSLTTSQLLATIGNLVEAAPGNRANAYISKYGRGIMLAGTTGASKYFEVLAIDWLKFQMKAAVFNVLAAQKTDLTDAGVQSFVAVVRGVLAQGVANRIINPFPGNDDNGNPLPGISVTAPAVSTLTASQKAGGVCPTITFTCTLAGPINAVAVRGTLKN